MCRALQSLKSHSVDLTRLLTHTGTGATLVEEAVDKNRMLFIVIHKVAGWHHSEADQDTDAPDRDIPSTLGFSSSLTSHSSLSSLVHCESQDMSSNRPVREGHGSHVSTSDEEKQLFGSKPRKVFP